MQHYPKPQLLRPRTAQLLAGLGASPDPYAQAALIPNLGMYSLPYATTWPELSNQLATIYQAKAADIPWLPANWITSVMALHGKNGQVLIPAPANVTPPIPWLRSDEQRAWWNQFNQQANAAIVNYAANKAAQGKVELDKLYANAEFWNTGFGATMIDIQDNLRTAGSGIADTFRNPMKYLLIGGAVLAVLMVAKAKLLK